MKRNHSSNLIVSIICQLSVLWLSVSGADTQKFMDENTAITNYGLVTWSGLGAITAADGSSLPGSPAVVNMAGGVFQIQGDATLQVSISSLIVN